MRIGVDVRHLTGGNPSGVDHYTLSILRALVSAHSEHTFVLLSTGSAPQARTHAKQLLGDLLGRRHVTHIHRAVPNRLLNLSILLTGYPRFEHLFGKDPVDVIWCPNINFLPRTKRPLVVTFHDLSFEMTSRHDGIKRRLWHKLVRPKRIASQARRLIVPSATTKTDLARLYHVDPEKIHVIPHGIEVNFRPRTLPQDHGVRSRHDLPRNYLLHVGTHEARKNIPRLVEAFLEAKCESDRLRQDDLKLVLAGSPGDILIPRHPDVVHLGYVPDKDLPALYRQAKLLLFPSYYEGFGLPILEAFASATPVITSHTSAMLEVGGPAAIFIDPYNTRDITAAIVQVMEDPKLQEHLKQTGLQRVQSYRWEKAAEETLAVLTVAAKIPT